MRVVHVMQGASAIYGAERVIFAELATSRTCGVDARFLMLEELRDGEGGVLMGDYAERLGIPVIRVPVSGRISWRMIKQARDAIVGARAQVVHTHSYKGDVIGFAAARLARVPVVGELHGWLFPKDDYQIRFYEWLDVQVTKRMDRVVVLADHYRRIIRRMGYPERRIRVIPSGVDVEGLRAASGKVDIRARLGVGSSVPLVGALTRLSHEKGVDIFLHLIRFVARRHPQVRGVIFGTGDEEEPLRALAAELGIAERIIWAGYVEEAMDALLALDVVAQTSRYEALPQSLMEAMVMERPVVVTPVGGCPDLVRDGETGFVAPAVDPELLAAAVCHLIEHPERARAMGEAGGERITSSYTMDHWARRMKKLYDELAGTGG